jgi:hypothetical protein
MLIAKCSRVAFIVDGKRVAAPKGATLLHDPSGRYWPKQSCLIASFSRDGDVLENPTDEEIAWATNPDAVKVGSAETPSKSLSGWDIIGRVERIDYTRRGVYADDYEHDFEEGWLQTKPLPTLRRLGRYMRLGIALEQGRQFNWRGFIG